MLGSFVGFVIVECLGDDVTKVDAAHDEAELGQVALVIPPEQDEGNGQSCADDVKHWCHGSAPHHFKVHIESHGVLEVVGVGSQLVCVVVLKPQAVVGVVTDNLVSPAVAVALDGVLAVVCVELEHI